MLVVLCTYLTPFFFESLNLGSFLSYAKGLSDWSFSSSRFWKSIVVPHCFFSGFCGVMYFGGLSNKSPLLRLAVPIYWFLGYLLFLILLELAQVFIPGRTVSGGDVFIHLIAFGAGFLVGGVFQTAFGFCKIADRFSLKCVVVWVLVLVYLSIYPLSFSEDPDGSLLQRFVQSLKEAPRKSDLVANLLLGWPIAWILLDALQSKRHAGPHQEGQPYVGIDGRISGSPAKYVQHIGLVLILVMLGGLFVETLQHFFAQRFPSLLDVVFQMLGALLASAIFFALGLNRFHSAGMLLRYLGRRSLLELMCLWGVLGFLVFEWTPWVPSIEISTLREGIRELVLPLAQADYPWDLHWQSYPLSVLAVFFFSLFAGLAIRMLIRPVFGSSRIGSVCSILGCFFGLFVELGKVVVATKYATPLLVLAALIGGLLLSICFLFLSLSSQPSKQQTQESGA